nr:hypothetical protein [Pseudomonas fluorescens]
MLGYEYDPLSNLTTLTLPDGRKVNHLYYGSGQLHQLNLDGQVISDRDSKNPAFRSSPCKRCNDWRNANQVTCGKGPGNSSAGGCG